MTVTWITPNDLSKLSTSYISDSARMISTKGLKSSSTHLLPARSIVISSRAPIGYVAIPLVDFCTNQGCKSIVLNDEYNSEFAYYNLNFHVDKLKNLGNGTTFTEITKTALCTIGLPFPKRKEEQTHIAAVLSCMDRAIEQTETLIAKQQHIKTGLMQDLLTKGIDEHGNIRSEATHEFKDSRLGRIPKEWRIFRFEELTTADAPICYGIVQPGGYDPHGIPVVAINSMNGNYSNLHLCSPEIEKNYLRSRVRGNDVLLSVKGTTGRVDIIPKKFKGNISRDIARIRPNQDVSPYYLRHLLSSPTTQRYLENATVGTTRAEISIGILRRLYVSLPMIDEQERISSLLDAQDRYIKNEMTLLHKLRNLKSGMMQDLLTGKVSVESLLAEHTAVSA